MTGIAGALFGAQTLVWIYVSKCLFTCPSCDVTLSSLSLLLCIKQVRNSSAHMSPPLIWLASFTPSFFWPLVAHFQPSSSFFSYIFLPSPGVPCFAPRTQHFPTECAAEGLAIVSCYREGGGRPADFLAANSGSMSVWEKAAKTDVMMTEKLFILETDLR